MDDLRNVWQQQEVNEMKFSVTELRRRAAAFERRIRRRNQRELTACLLVIVLLGWSFVRAGATVPRLAFGLMIAGALYAAWHLIARGAAKALPSEMGTGSCLAFYRRELEQQRDLARSVWTWYLGPLIPGIVLLVVWGISILPAEKRWYPMPFATLSVLSFWLIDRRSRSAARRLDRQIEELKLDAAEEGLDSRS